MKPENRWSLWAFEEENLMSTHVETGEREPIESIFCETCGRVCCICELEPDNLWEDDGLEEDTSDS